MTIHQSRLRASSSRAALSPLLVLVLVIAPSAQAQTILLKTGQTIETKGVRRSGDMVMIKVQVGASSGEVGYRASTIAKIAFPEPPPTENHRGFSFPRPAGKGPRGHRADRKILRALS